MPIQLYRCPPHSQRSIGSPAPHTTLAEIPQPQKILKKKNLRNEPNKIKTNKKNVSKKKMHKFTRYGKTRRIGEVGAESYGWKVCWRRKMKRIRLFLWKLLWLLSATWSFGGYNGRTEWLLHNNLHGLGGFFVFLNLSDSDTNHFFRFHYRSLGKLKADKGKAVSSLTFIDGK